VRRRFLVVRTGHILVRAPNRLGGMGGHLSVNSPEHEILQGTLYDFRCKQPFCKFFREISNRLWTSGRIKNSV
jgi:hypothetical protein